MMLSSGDTHKTATLIVGMGQEEESGHVHHLPDGSFTGPNMSEDHEEVGQMIAAQEVMEAFENKDPRMLLMSIKSLIEMIR